MLRSLENSRKTLSERAASQIVNYIVDNELESGSRLPNELQLSEALQVGRSTVREAIRILVSRNIVEIIRGRGTVVANKPGVADDPLGFQFVKDKEKLVFDLLETRLIIEPKIAALAATRATEDDIVRMNSLANEIERLMRQNRSHEAKDVELHAYIAECTENEVITSLIPILNKSIYIFTEFTDKRILKESIDTHRQIVSSIAARDSAAAEDAMTRHIQFNKQLIEHKLLAKSETEAKTNSTK